jgi:hypothetical protein
MNTRVRKYSNNKETNRERFVRIAERRVNRVLNDLDSLGKCSSCKNYEYSDEDVRKIFRVIERKVREIKSSFKESSKNRNRFQLKG